MSEAVLWILIIIGISISAAIKVCLEHYFNRKKRAAETEEIKLKNKITKEITYDQLKTESKQKDIKGKLDIFQRLVELEEEIKKQKTITASDQKKLESLEMIKKEFRQSFGEEENGPKLVGAEMGVARSEHSQKRLEAKKENDEENKGGDSIAEKNSNKKIKPSKTNFQSKNQKKKSKIN